MPLDHTQPEVIKFLAEQYEKTARLRQLWVRKNAAKIAESFTFQNEKGYFKKDIHKKELEICMPFTSRDHKLSAVNRKLKEPIDRGYIPTVKDLKKGHSIPEIGLGDPVEDPRLNRPDTDLSIDPLMRPIDPQQKSILYQDGRRAYLKSRLEMKQEDKYYFQQSSTWDYGWRLKDTVSNRAESRYPRDSQLTIGTLSRTGPQPDPWHYVGSHKISKVKPKRVCLK